ncbi:MAG: sigma factor-like helix-turn-helix DNA-binding protein [Christensenellales bacterium]
MTKDDLKKIPMIERAIEEKRIMLKEIREVMYYNPALSANERVQTSVTNRSMNKVDAAVDLERVIHEDCLKLIELKCDAYNLIRGIEDPLYRELMELRYINGLTWREIAEKIGKTERRAHQMHGEILLKIFK